MNESVAILAGAVAACARVDAFFTGSSLPTAHETGYAAPAARVSRFAVATVPPASENHSVAGEPDDARRERPSIGSVAVTSPSAASPLPSFVMLQLPGVTTDPSALTAQGTVVGTFKTALGSSAKAASGSAPVPSAHARSDSASARAAKGALPDDAFFSMVVPFPRPPRAGRERPGRGGGLGSAFFFPCGDGGGGRQRRRAHEA